MHRSAAREDPSDNPRAVAGDNSRKRDVKRTAEELRAKFLKDYAGAGAPYRPRLLAAAAISDLSDGAFRVLAVRSIYANADGTSCTVSQDTLGTLLRKSRRTIERLDNELKGWEDETCKVESQPKNQHAFISIRQRHPEQGSAIATLIHSEKLDRVIAELSSLDPTKMTGLNNPDPTKMTGLPEQMCSDPTNLSFRPDKNDGQPCSSYPEEKEDSLSETPFSDGEHDDGLFSGQGARNGIAAKKHTGTGNGKASVSDEALVLYNESARRYGWSVCQKLTDSRRKRCEKRIADIGGIEQFSLALSAAPSNDFLMGRRPPRDGSKRFRLDIDSLLSDGSGMGDVLARLLDAAMDAQSNGGAHDIEAEVTRVAETPIGKRLIAEKGRNAALVEIRAWVLADVGSAQHA